MTFKFNVSTKLYAKHYSLFSHKACYFATGHVIRLYVYNYYNTCKIVYCIWFANGHVNYSIPNMYLCDYNYIANGACLSYLY